MPPDAPSSSPTDAGFRISCLRLTLILVGFMVTLPSFVMGAQISAALGFYRALGASFGGGLLLAVVAAIAAIVAVGSRKSTYELIVDAFGQVGARLINGMMALSLLGWFGVIAALFGESLSSLLEGALAKVVPAWTLLGAALVTVTIFWGFKALNRISLIITPLSMALLIWVVWVSLENGMEPILQANATLSLSLGNGISLVAGGLFVGATLVPDLCRYARNSGHAILACVLAFALCDPIVLMLSGIAVLASGEQDLIQLMVALGLGIPALITVLLTAWGTNAGNLYSSCLVARTIWPTRPWWQLVLGGGILGTAVALSGWTQNLTGFLILLSLSIPPVAAIYLVHFISARYWPAPVCRWRKSALITWLIGVGCAAVLNWNAISVTGIPALDAFLFAALLYAVLQGSVHGMRSRALTSARNG